MQGKLDVKSKSNRINNFIGLLIILFVIPLVIILGTKLLDDRKYNLVSLIIVLLSIAPFLLRFERRKPKAREIVCISIMSAISIAGRLIFVILPGFKPVTAIVSITGIAFGPEAGFLTGAISALVSNIYFGQGLWTPFQILAWGIIGFIAGILARYNIMNNKMVLILYGVFSGFLFSLMMDIWVVLSIEGLFSWNKYYIAIVAALPFTLLYCVSNVLFLLLLSKPIGEKLERIKIKYGLMGD